MICLKNVDKNKPKNDYPINFLDIIIIIILEKYLALISVKCFIH